MSDTNQKDLVLSINEYSYVLDETKGHVSCLVGPTKMSLSQSDKLVRFNSKTKTFDPCTYDEAKHLFTIIPENWYGILKNPVKDNKHPTPGASNALPENICIGQKINVRGPASFALYPGQMAKVVKGHALRTNQYLLARVYEAEAANSSQGDIRDAEGNLVDIKEKYTNGQMLIIKGTEISFYIPPTGIEVIPLKNDSTNGYIREAVTLERLEYCILKDEDGNKRYVHGPEVVFPKATESFVSSPKGGFIFRAIELSKISGIYVKVIAEYTDENKVVHPVGEELFITGEDQMIYYPRPEHAIINYDEKIMHHAIAIPEGEGRYIMDRLTGEIKTKRGPAMYLPDPRTEVVVKRKLTPSQCSLWYPGNTEVANYNENLSEKSVEKSMRAQAKGANGHAEGALNCLTTDLCSTANYNTITTCAALSYTVDDILVSNSGTLAQYETNASIGRGTSYTKPRTITLDNKYDGVVSIDVWTGYAVNVVSKTGERKVICGPQTILLDYDQTLEVLQMSTGKPKTNNRLIKTVYLRHENNKVSDIIEIETKDFVKAFITVSYCVDFLPEHQDKWFNVEDYVKYLTDRQRSLVKRAAKEYNIETFYQNYSDIVRNIAINATETDKGRLFEENGMCVHDCEVLSIEVEPEVMELLEKHQIDMVEKSLELSAAEKRIEVIEALAEAEGKDQELRTAQLLNKLALQKKEVLAKLELESEIKRTKEAEEQVAKQAEQDMQPVLDAIEQAKIAREQAHRDAEIAHKTKLADLEAQKQKTYADTVAAIMASIGPDLVAAMTSKSNSEMTVAISEALAPYALAKGESVTEVVNGLLRGTTLEDVVKGVKLDI